MEYSIYTPAEKLRELIQFFWVFETEASRVHPYTHPATASGYAKLAFQYNGAMFVQQGRGEREQLFTSGLQAQTRSAQHYASHEPIGVFGIYFQPYAIPFLFSIPAGEISSQNISLCSLLGKQGTELEERVLLAKSNQERLHIVSLFFEKRLASASYMEHRIISSINHIVKHKGMLPIEELVSRNCLSQRQFERKFKHLTGFSPKMFSRIIRFENSLDLYLQQDVSLTETAHTFGYYDQSHFIRDFKEFAGQHPSAYFSEDLSMFVSA